MIALVALFIGITAVPTIRNTPEPFALSFCSLMLSIVAVTLAWFLESALDEIRKTDTSVSVCILAWFSQYWLDAPCSQNRCAQVLYLRLEGFQRGVMITLLTVPIICVNWAVIALVAALILFALRSRLISRLFIAFAFTFLVLIVFAAWLWRSVSMSAQL